ncbi:MAG: transcription elongation factor GreA [Candidatus Liptonbacteria bacterium]|nr:transcription elongation factor GreA [Candidatus Liptonbacteria bacterium]
MDEHYFLSQERFEELKSELEFLKTDKRQEIADRLKQAKEYGDLSENAEYTEARDEQSRVEVRIFELDEVLKRAVIIKKSGHKDTISVGSTVTVKKDGQVVTYNIVGSDETRPEEGKISNESPLGRMLLGHKVGDSVILEARAGKATFQITKVE